MSEQPPYRELAELLQQMRSRPLGLHGTKAKWTGDILRRGLTRPDAGWFALQPASGSVLGATFALACYFALSLRVCNELAQQSAEQGYTHWFVRHPEDFPVLLFFKDARRQHETWNRYLCLAPGYVELTVPYTKTARAGRQVPSEAFVYQPYSPTFFDLYTAEQEAQQRLQYATAIEADSTSFVRKCCVNGEPLMGSSLPLHAVQSKLAYFCTALADQMITCILPVLHTSIFSTMQTSQLFADADNWQERI